MKRTVKFSIIFILVTILLSSCENNTNIKKPLPEGNDFSKLSATTAVGGMLEGSVFVEGYIDKWLIDEVNQNIYALLGNIKKVQVFDINTLAVKGEFQISSLSDIGLYGGKLYVADENKNQVDIINIQTLEIESQINLSRSPYKIAILNNKIYYTSRYYKSWEGAVVDFSKIFVYDLQSATETEVSAIKSVPGFENISDRFRITDFAADENKNRLYINSYDTSYSNIFVLDTTNNTIKDYNKKYGFYNGQYRMFLADDDIYYGRYRIDKTDVNMIYGMYEEPITYAKGNYVFSQKAIYDKASFIRISDFKSYNGSVNYISSYINFILDSKSNVYLTSGTSYPLYKGEIDKFTNLLPVNVMKNPNDTAAFDYSSDSVAVATKAKRLNITQWKVDEVQKTIYAISNETNSLMFIGLDDLKLKNQIIVGKAPRYIDMADGKLYVSLTDLNQVAIVDIASQSVERNLILQHMPGAVAVEGDKLFYMGYDYSPSYKEFPFHPYVYDMTNSTEKAVTDFTYEGFLKSNMALDKVKHILYMGGNQFNGVSAINTLDHKAYSVNRFNELTYKPGIVSLNNNILFYSVYNLNETDITSIYGKAAESIIYHNDKYAFSTKSIYDIARLDHITNLPLESSSVFVDTKSNVFLFDNSKKAIKKLQITQLTAGYEATYKASLNSTDYSVAPLYGNAKERKMNHLKIILDEDKDLIYAISPDSYKLQFIGKDDLILKKELVIGYSAVDLKLYNGKLYISTYYGNYIAVVDTNTQAIINKIKLSERPKLVAVEGNKIFYTGDLKTHAYDMNTGVESDISFYDYKYGTNINYIESLFVDKDNQILYGMKGASTPIEAIYAIRIKDMSPIRPPLINYTQSTVYNDGVAVFDKDELFQGQTAYNRGNFYMIMHKYLGIIAYVGDKYVITAYSMYSRDTGEKLGDLPDYYDNMKVDKAGNAYVIVRYSYLKKTSIDEILQSLKNKTDAYYGKGTGTVSDPDLGVVFKDIVNNWARKDIEVLAARHIVQGTGTGFSPSSNITRAEFVTLLVRALELNIENQGNISFPDVTANAWYASTARTAYSNGLVKGDQSGRFNPNTLITREEMAVMLIRAIKLKNPSFNASNENILLSFIDNRNISSWAKSDTASAADLGIIKGKPGDIFDPKALSTRAESAVMVKRFLDKTEQ